jgi:hypothetical protein
MSLPNGAPILASILAILATVLAPDHSGRLGRSV